MKKIIVLSGFLCVALYSGVLSAEELYYVAPTHIPHTERLMKTAGFWISRLSSPDEIVLTPQEVAGFNRTIQNELRLTKDIAQLPQEISGRELSVSLEMTLSEFAKKTLYLSGGQKADKDFYEKIRQNVGAHALDAQIKAQYGIVVHFTDQRFFPTDEGLYAKKGDIDFDELQNSSLDVGTPVRVLNKSSDGKWYYAESSLSDGWVKAENVGLCPLEQWTEDFSPKESFLVVTAPKADIFLNEGLTAHYDFVPMGTVLPMAKGDHPKGFQIILPTRNDDGTLNLIFGYVPKDQAGQGYLSYTPRVIIDQAFKLLNAPYGWGGMNGEQDCSWFLHEVFSTVGVNLPRDSKNQAKVGQLIAQFDEATAEAEKLGALKKVSAGAIVLPLKGHIMLFLGMAEDRPYAIHALWGYREKINGKDTVRVINRVAVTDLSLGEGSDKGSLLQRVISIRAIAK